MITVWVLHRLFLLLCGCYGSNPEFVCQFAFAEDHVDYFGNYADKLRGVGGGANLMCSEVSP